MSVCLPTILISLVWLIYGDDINPLCDCYYVSLKSTSGLSLNDIICYTYSITFNSENEQCKQNGITNMILGVCNDENTQFNSESLHESIMSITPHQTILISNELTNSMTGLQLKIDNEIKICMKHVNTDGTTSNNIGYILNNNEIITCNNIPNQSGLPCKSLQLSQSEIQNQIKHKPKTLIENGKNILKTPENNMATVINKNGNDISIDLQNGSDKTSITKRTRTYIKVVFICIMIFICLHAIFCVLIALRQSGALDQMKYFNNNDTCIQIVENGNNNNLKSDIDNGNIDSDSESDKGNDLLPIFNEMRFKNLKAMRSAHSINDSNFRLMINLSKLQENSNSDDNTKDVQVNQDQLTFME